MKKRAKNMMPMMRGGGLTKKPTAMKKGGSVKKRAKAKKKNK
tara:strand:+ start:586 stop:711 length:126 start_codon:yes stop_codon:yes gene_type:complete